MFEKMTLEEYNQILASKSPTPGGGSALAVVGTIACSLVEMSINVTLTKLDEDCENYKILHSNLSFFARAKSRLQQLSNDDATAFQQIIECNRLPKNTAEEQQHRTCEQQKAYHKATLVPLDVMRICKEALSIAKLRVFPLLYKYVASDCKIGIDLFAAIIENSKENVYANTCLISDVALKTLLESQCVEIAEQARKI